MKQAISLISLIIFVLSCNGQTGNKVLKLSDVSFNSIFGFSKIDSTYAYCLLGRGFFLTRRSDNSDSLILDWMNKHPLAIVIPVSSFGPVMSDDKNSKITYCWLVDGNDTINNYLVRNGCFPGGTMQRPETWSEMPRKEKSFYKGEEKPVIKVLLDKKTYNSFIEQIKVAEQFAKTSKIGIWLNSENE